MERSISRRTFLKLSVVTGIDPPNFLTTLAGNDPPLVVGASGDGRLNVLFKAYLNHPTDVPKDVQELVQADPTITRLISIGVVTLAYLVNFRLDSKKLTQDSEAKIQAALSTLMDAVSEAQTVPDSQPDSTPAPQLKFSYPQA